jgi:hypothetical protein
MIYREISGKDYLMELMECKTKLIIINGRLTHVDRFRWVALQLSALDTCNSPDEVTEQLQSLPQDLNESTNADIKLYIDSKMQESRQLTLWSHDIQRNIRERLLDGADGM